jgi:thioredoxin 1
MFRRTFVALVVCALTGLATHAASSVKPYSKASFTETLSSAEAVVVHVHADWCPICRKQQPTIQSLAADPSMPKVAFVQVDFDKDRDFLKSYKVSSQSTILIFRGGKEVARLNGVTDPARIKQKLQAALS